MTVLELLAWLDRAICFLWEKVAAAAMIYWVWLTITGQMEELGNNGLGVRKPPRLS
jgi:hypothetical protein